MLENYQLPSVNIVANETSVVTLRDLPLVRRGRLPHLQSVLFETDLTPTFTTAPTTVGVNNVLSQCDFWDGRINRFVGGFNELRAHERINTGRNRLPDADTDTASASARYFRRVLHLGPPQAAGGIDYNGTDFCIPNGALQSGEIRVTVGALTSISADTTAMTGTVRVFAQMQILDELRIPPAYQVTKQSLTTPDIVVPGRALLCSLYLANSTAFDAWAAADLGNLKLDLGQGEIIQTIPNYALTSAYWDSFRVGEVGGFSGPPRGATDDNEKIVNRGTPTALAAAPNDLQPVVWMSPEQKLSKCELAEANMRLSWDGSQTTAYMMMGRILPQDGNTVGAIAGAALKALGKDGYKSITVKTLSKKPYNGPLAAFMPFAVKV